MSLLVSFTTLLILRKRYIDVYEINLSVILKLPFGMQQAFYLNGVLLSRCLYLSKCGNRHKERKKVVF